MTLWQILKYTFIIACLNFVFDLENSSENLTLLKYDFTYRNKIYKTKTIVDNYTWNVNVEILNVVNIEFMIPTQWLGGSSMIYCLLN